MRVFSCFSYVPSIPIHSMLIKNQQINSYNLFLIITKFPVDKEQLI